MPDYSDVIHTTYDRLCAHVRELALLASAESLLEWDERTTLPPAGGEYRAEQISLLAGLVHQRETAPQLGEWLAELTDSPLAADPYSDTGAVIRHVRRDYEKKTKLPQALVEELARLAVLGQRTWAEARRENDFARFRPLLERTIKLKREQAAAIGYDDVLYDALLDDFEPGEKTATIAPLLAALRDALVPIVDPIVASGRVAPRLPERSFPIRLQAAFGRRVAEAIGFDFNAGRLDVTDHPFCAELGPHDVRITTRYDERSPISSLFSILHEAGHGIYDQGLPADDYGLPTGQPVSHGIHESQSRLWENLVGRSRAFWEYFYADAQAIFGPALADVSLDDFYTAINRVEPSLIRTEADEATYNLHILVRFELEQALLDDQLPVADLPGAWNEKYRQYLGIEPPNDADGVLQDVHWSAGLFGYFPTYALGNLYAAQFFAAARRDLGELDGMFRRGEFGPLREWLRANVHLHGRRYSAAELVQRATGRPLSHDALVQHLRDKFTPLWGLA
jgi:carboxypeptidase Taq